MKRYTRHSSSVTRGGRTYLELEFPIAEEGRLAQYFKTLVAIFDARFLIVTIQIRIGLDESGQPLNVGNNPFQSLFEAILTWRYSLGAVTPTAKVQFLIPCCWTSGVDIVDGPPTCFDGVLEIKTVAGLDVAEEARGSQGCEPE